MRCLSFFLLFCLLQAMSSTALGVLQTYTDRPSWAAAVAAQNSLVSEETFNSVSDQSFAGTNIALDDFFITTNSTDNSSLDINSIDAAPFGDGGFDRNSDGSTYVLGGYSTGQFWIVSFLSNLVFAFGWDSPFDFDGNWRIGGVDISYQNSDFFGVVDDTRTTFVGIEMTGWDATFGVDNFVYALPGIPGDFDDDGDVDGFDFLLWQRGGSPDPLSQSDLALWEANYSTSVNVQAAVKVVPECSSLMLLIMGTAAFLGRSFGSITGRHRCSSYPA